MEISEIESRIIWERSMKPKSHSLRKSIKLINQIIRKNKKRRYKVPIFGMNGGMLWQNLQILKGWQGYLVAKEYYEQLYSKKACSLDEMEMDSVLERHKLS